MAGASDASPAMEEGEPWEDLTPSPCTVPNNEAGEEAEGGLAQPQAEATEESGEGEPSRPSPGLAEEGQPPQQAELCSNHAGEGHVPNGGLLPGTGAEDDEDDVEVDVEEDEQGWMDTGETAWQELTPGDIQESEVEGAEVVVEGQAEDGDPAEEQEEGEEKEKKEAAAPDAGDAAVAECPVAASEAEEEEEVEEVGAAEAQETGDAASGAESLFTAASEAVAEDGDAAAMEPAPAAAPEAACAAEADREEVMETVVSPEEEPPQSFLGATSHSVYSLPELLACRWIGDHAVTKPGLYTQARSNGFAKEETGKQEEDAEDDGQEEEEVKEVAVSPALWLNSASPKREDKPFLAPDNNRQEEPEEVKDAQPIRPPPGLGDSPSRAFLSTSPMTEDRNRGFPTEGLVRVPRGLDGEELSLTALRAAAAASALTMAVGEVVKPSAVHETGPSSEAAVPTSRGIDAQLPGVVANSLFVCFVASSGTSVKVVSQQSLAVIASVSSEGAKVVDLALQAEDSHLLVAFDNGRVIVYRLSNDSAAARVLLKFDDPPVLAVLWHPTNPRLFLTLHSQRALLWHLQLIVSGAQLSGFLPLEEEGVKTALQVTPALVENAASEVLPQIMHSGSANVVGARRLHELLEGATEGPEVSEQAQETGGPLRCVSFPFDAQFLVACTDRSIWLWQLSTKDEQTAPRAVCAQRHELPDGLDSSISQLRLLPCFGADSNYSYVLMAATRREVLLWTLDPRPSGGTGHWVPTGRLLCPVQQRLRFPCRVSADAFVPWGCDRQPTATLLVALESDEESRTPLLLAGKLQGGRQAPLAPIVPELHAFHSAELPSTPGGWRLVGMRGFERSQRAKALADDGGEAQTWAIVGLAQVTGQPSGCCCLALPRLPETAGSKPFAPFTTGLAAPPPLPGLAAGALAAPERNDEELEATGQETEECDDAGPDMEEGEAPGVDEVEVDTEEQTPEAPLPAAVAAEGSGPEQRSSGSRREHKDTDSVTPQMIKRLGTFMEKSVAKCGQSTIDSVKKRVPEQIKRATQERKGRSRERRSREGEETLQAVIKESIGLTDHVNYKERQATLAIKKIADPESMKQAAARFKEPVEKELGRWRDTLLPKAVLKVAEGRAFAEQFSEGLKSGPQDSSLLVEALRPDKKQLQEALQADLKDWCTSAVAKRSKVPLQEIGLLQVRGAMEAALKEVATQTGKAFDQIMQETRAKACTQQLSAVCARHVSAAVRQEVQAWEAELKRPLPPPSPSELRRLREGFGHRMRAAVQPLQRELEGAGQQLQQAAAALERCGEHADTVEASIAARGRASSSRGPTFREEKEGVLSELARGQVRKALDRALRWDSRSEAAPLSLVEMACQHLRSANGEAADDLPSPEEVLMRPEVACEVDSGLKLLLADVLLKGTLAFDCPLERLETNLDWALAFLQATEADEESAQAAVSVESSIQAALEQLKKGEQPPALAEASPAARKQVAATARLALKGLGLLVRLRPKA